MPTPMPHRHVSAPDAGTPACAAACPLASAGVGRREFLSQAVLAAAAVALAACGAGSTDPAGGSVTVPPGSTLRVADYPTLAATGGVALVSLGGASVAIVRTGTTAFVALSRVCPHEGGTINRSASGFLCSLHGAQFNGVGTWTGGERTSSMRSFATSYDATSGVLTVG